MKRKTLLLILGSLAAVLLAGYGTLRLTAPRHRITDENFAAIQKGMTEAEVEAILGVPAGVYSSKGNTGFYGPPLAPFMGFGGSSIEKEPIWGEFLLGSGSFLVQTLGGKEWVGEDLCVYVRFEAERVVATRCGEIIPSTDVSFLAKLRRWFGM
jgi:hypothetical protein